MGGQAFQALLGSSATFPRMHRPVYERLKEHVLTCLASRFSSIMFAPEDPEKTTFGDLDIIVTPNSDGWGKNNMRQELMTLLRAEHAVSNGPAFMTFAIPEAIVSVYGSANDTQWPSEMVASFGQGHSEQVSLYYQVDVNFARNQEEGDAIVFYNSYGDLGMMVALLTKTIGLSYSRSGLRLSDPHYLRRIENKKFYLTTSTPAAMAFLGLDLEVWKHGFESRTPIFDWIITSRFADKRALLDISPKHLDRPLYQQFLQYLSTGNDTAPSHSTHVSTRIVEEALAHFGKKDEYEQQARDIELRKALKIVLNGHIVESITGKSGPVVRDIIAKVKELVGVEELVKMSKKDVSDLVLEAESILKVNIG